MYPKRIVNFNLFVDGNSYKGKGIDAKLPELKIKTADHLGAGMDVSVAVDVGMESLEAEFTLIEWAPELIEMFGTTQSITLRPVDRDEEFGANAYITSLRGKFTIVNFADLKPGDDVPLKITCAVSKYKMEHKGKVLFDIDAIAGKRIIGGVDQLAAQRKAMGL